MISKPAGVGATSSASRRRVSQEELLCNAPNARNESDVTPRILLFLARFFCPVIFPGMFGLLDGLADFTAPPA
jgi:hypothetical protein